MTGFTESVVEEAALAWLGEVGYDVWHGAELEAVEGWGEDVVLRGRLRDALGRLNPELPAEALDDAFRKLLAVEAPTLVERNRAVHRLLVDGVNVEYRRSDGSIAGAQARVLDFDDPVAGNDRLAVNQVAVVEGRHARRLARRRRRGPRQAGRRPIPAHLHPRGGGAAPGRGSAVRLAALPGAALSQCADSPVLRGAPSRGPCENDDRSAVRLERVERLRAARAPRSRLCRCGRHRCRGRRAAGGAEEGRVARRGCARAATRRVAGEPARGGRPRRARTAEPRGRAGEARRRPGAGSESPSTGLRPRTS